jgi:hypothetical protein
MSINTTVSTTATVSNASSGASSKSSEQFAQLEKLGEKVGAFKPYDSQLTIADIAGLRTVKVLYRFKDESKRDKVNSYVRIPNRHLSESSILARIDDLMPFVTSYLESIEDGMIKELHSKGQLNIYPESLSLDKILEVLESTTNNGRLTKELIGNWFDEVLSDSLTTAFATKLGLDLAEESLAIAIDSGDEETLRKIARIEQVVAMYKDKLESLASPKVSFKEEDQAALLGMFNKIPDVLENSVGRRLHSRISNMANKEDELLLSL